VRDGWVRLPGADPAGFAVLPATGAPDAFCEATRSEGSVFAGFLAALGGGTLRDPVIDRPPPPRFGRALLLHVAPPDARLTRELRRGAVARKCRPPPLCWVPPPSLA